MRTAYIVIVDVSKPYMNVILFAVTSLWTIAKSKNVTKFEAIFREESDELSASESHSLGVYCLWQVR